MMQHAKHIFLMTWLLLLLGVLSAFGQLKFRVTDFAADPFDLTARNDQYKKVDGSGSLYAIIKVSGEEGDKLSEYQFNFGNMNHLIEEHDGLLWIYVQKNAKRVTIRRNGYAPLLNHDLQTTIEEGKTYRMKLSAQGPVVYTQMVMFQVKPADAKAVVMIRQEDSGSEESMLGMADASGVIAKNMPFGTYTYRAVAENYYSSEGRFTLNNQDETHREQVTLRPRFSQITFMVDGGAEIWVNGEKKGTGSWTGPLNAGVYSVECRQMNHRNSSQSVSVEENTPRTIALTPPTPIVGTLSVISSPVGATIKIDGKDYGTTPRNITKLLIGQHNLTLSLNGYGEKTETVEVKENETSEVNLQLAQTAIGATPSTTTPVTSSVPSSVPSSIPSASGGRTFTVKGVSFVMMPVEGGTFQMGGTAEQGRDAYDGEKPVHNVTLSSYSIGQTEVKQALWKAVMGSNPSYRKGDNLPVEKVAWNDCQTFITKLNHLTGQKFRLPTEAEWEYAARGGKQSKGYKYSGSNTPADVAWYEEKSDGKSHPVATKLPNELGLYDMSGNVWEWCQDWYGSYSSTTQSNPTGPSSGSYRVHRGGSWRNFAGDCRVSHRHFNTPSGAFINLGFRLAL